MFCACVLFHDFSLFQFHYDTIQMYGIEKRKSSICLRFLLSTIVIINLVLVSNFSTNEENRVPIAYESDQNDSAIGTVLRFYPDRVFWLRATFGPQPKAVFFHNLNHLLLSNPFFFMQFRQVERIEVISKIYFIHSTKSLIISEVSPSEVRLLTPFFPYFKSIRWGSAANVEKNLLSVTQVYKKYAYAFSFP